MATDQSAKWERAAVVVHDIREERRDNGALDPNTASPFSFLRKKISFSSYLSTHNIL